MLFKISYQEIQKLAKNYLLGTCVSAFDEDANCVIDELPYNTVTDFALDEENNFAKAEKAGIKVIYDKNTDTHYFYKKAFITNNTNHILLSNWSKDDNPNEVKKWVEGRLYLFGLHADKIDIGTSGPNAMAFIKIENTKGYDLNNILNQGKKASNTIK